LVTGESLNSPSIIFNAVKKEKQRYELFSEKLSKPTLSKRHIKVIHVCNLKFLNDHIKKEVGGD
jgi:hypothetical protein